MNQTYRKITTVQAEQQTKEFKVDTLEGTLYGQKGDYLVTGIEGEQWVVNKVIFEETYIVVPNVETCPLCYEKLDGKKSHGSWCK